MMKKNYVTVVQIGDFSMPESNNNIHYKKQRSHNNNNSSRRCLSSHNLFLKNDDSQLNGDFLLSSAYSSADLSANAKNYKIVGKQWKGPKQVAAPVGEKEAFSEDLRWEAQLGEEQQQIDKKLIKKLRRDQLCHSTSNLAKECSSVEEQINIYRCVDQNLGLGLRFVGGARAQEYVKRLFVQFCNPESPAGKVQTSWGKICSGDEILKISTKDVRDLTRVQCVEALKKPKFVIKMKIRHIFTSFNKEVSRDKDSSYNPLQWRSQTLPEIHLKSYNKLVCPEIEEKSKIFLSPPALPPRKIPPRYTPSKLKQMTDFHLKHHKRSSSVPSLLTKASQELKVAEKENEIPHEKRKTKRCRSSMSLDKNSQDKSKCNIEMESSVDDGIASLNFEDESPLYDVPRPLNINKTYETDNSDGLHQPLSLEHLLDPFEQLEREFQQHLDNVRPPSGFDSKFNPTSSIPDVTSSTNDVKDFIEKDSYQTHPNATWNEILEEEGEGSPHMLHDHKILPPPSFCRSPPDGHEFPPEYSRESRINKGHPSAQCSSSGLKSVRDRIAMFSSSPKLFHHHQSSDNISSPYNNGNNNNYISRAFTHSDVRLVGSEANSTNASSSKKKLFEKRSSSRNVLCPTAPMATSIVSLKSVSSADLSNGLRKMSQKCSQRSVKKFQVRSQSLMEIGQKVNNSLRWESSHSSSKRKDSGDGHKISSDDSDYESAMSSAKSSISQSSLTSASATPRPQRISKPQRTSLSQAHFVSKTAKKKNSITEIYEKQLLENQKVKQIAHKPASRSSSFTVAERKKSFELNPDEIIGNKKQDGLFERFENSFRSIGRSKETKKSLKSESSFNQKVGKPTCGEKRDADAKIPKKRPSKIDLDSLEQTNNQRKGKESCNQDPPNIHKASSEAVKKLHFNDRNSKCLEKSNVESRDSSENLLNRFDFSEKNRTSSSSSFELKSPGSKSIKELTDKFEMKSKKEEESVEVMNQDNSTPQRKDSDSSEDQGVEFQSFDPSTPSPRLEIPNVSKIEHRKFSVPIYTGNQIPNQASGVKMRGKKDSNAVPSRPSSLIESESDISIFEIGNLGGSHRPNSNSTSRGSSQADLLDPSSDSNFGVALRQKSRTRMSSFNNSHSIRSSTFASREFLEVISQSRGQDCSSNQRCISVNDIRKAFEKAEQSLAQGMCIRDSANSDDSSEVTPIYYGSVSSLLSGSTNIKDHYGSISSLASSTSLISPQELQGLIDEANQSLEESGTPSHEIMVIVLHKEFTTGSIGITLAGGADYECKDITVHKVIPGTLADRDGRIQKGDRVLSINGRSTKGVSHREALSILKAPRTEVVLVLSRSRSVTPAELSFFERGETIAFNYVNIGSSRPPKILESPLDAKSLLSDLKFVDVPRGPPLTVVLKKEGTGLGFSLEGGRDSPLGDRPLTIKKIFTGGTADKSKILKVGDEILSVNSTDCSRMSRIEAWNFMKKLSDGNATIMVRQKLEDNKAGGHSANSVCCSKESMEKLDTKEKLEMTQI